jgi:hypothetical protein
MVVNSERMQLLVDALRSGEYQQTQGTLEDKIGNCCLGVACRVAMKHGLNIQIEIQSNGQTLFDDVDGVLPSSVSSWYGLESADPELILPWNETEPATMCNDRLNLNFNEIANAFERTFLS